MIKFLRCSFDDIKDRAVNYYMTNNIMIDDHWEDFIINGNCYNIMLNEEVIGCLSIYKENNITFFDINKKYNNIAQEVFYKARRLESVFGAYVVTGDEFLMSLCLDNFDTLEKSAYLSKYNNIDIKQDKSIEFSVATIDDIKIINEKYHDLFSASNEDVDNKSVYIARKNNEIAGFGRFGLGVLRHDLASIGLAVTPEFRQQGIGKNILLNLQDIAREKGLTPVSGCWYFNHNSLKTQHASGAYSVTRVIKFKF